LVFFGLGGSIFGFGYIDCEQLQEICAQRGVFSLPVVQVFFMGQKFIEEMRGFSLMG
jgi:thioredoxin-like negative regulator of GroEL